MNLNKVILIGRLTADPELRTTGSGRPVANFSMATNRYWTNDSGERQEETEFHNIVVWGRQAEVVNQFLSKGSLAMIEGRLQTRQWEDNNGNNRRTTEIVAQRVQFGPRSQGDGDSNFNSDFGGSKSADQTKKKGKDGGKQEEPEEDLPEINIDEEGEEIDPDDIPF